MPLAELPSLPSGSRCNAVETQLGDAGEAYFIYTQDEDKEAVKATKSVSMGDLPSRTSAPPTPTRPLPGAGPSRPGTAMLRSASLPSLAGQDRPASPPTDPDNHTGPPSSLASSMTSEEAAPEQRAPADTAAGGGGVMSWVWGWGKLPHSQTTTDRPVARAHRSLLLDTATGAAVREGPAGAAQRLGSAPAPRRKFRRHSTGGLLRSGPLVRATLPRIVQGLVQGVQGGGLPPLATSHSTLARACVALSEAVAGAAAQGSALQPAAVHDVANALTQLLSALAPPRDREGGDLCLQVTHPKTLVRSLISRALSAQLPPLDAPAGLLACLPWVAQAALVRAGMAEGPEPPLSPPSSPGRPRRGRALSGVPAGDALLLPPPGPATTSTTAAGRLAGALYSRSDEAPQPMGAAVPSSGPTPSPLLGPSAAPVPPLPPSRRGMAWRLGSWWRYNTAASDSDGAKAPATGMSDGELGATGEPAASAPDDTALHLPSLDLPPPMTQQDGSLPSEGVGGAAPAVVGTLTSAALAAVPSDVPDVPPDDDAASVATYTSVDSAGAEKPRAKGQRKRLMSLRPNSAQLKAMNLRPGKNTLRFVVWDRAEIAEVEAHRTALQEHARQVQEYEAIASRLAAVAAEEGAASRPASVKMPQPPAPPKAKDHATVTCDLYRWTPHTRVVISDVDGTITKSDALGHVYYWIGKDWTQDGVAELFANISANGYEVLYLTSRAIGQVWQTKNYLFNQISQHRRPIPGLSAAAAASSGRERAPRGRAADDALGQGGLHLGDGVVGDQLTKAFAAAAGSPTRSQPPTPVPASPGTAPGVGRSQGGGGESGEAEVAGRRSRPGDGVRVTLPPGPVITSPDRLITALTREVVLRQPQKFKIAALTDVLQLFPPTDTPFVAGFGNRQTDAVSYEAVRIPPSRIFIINPSGVIRVGGDARVAGSTSFSGSYWAMNDIVDELFPPLLCVRHAGTPGCAAGAPTAAVSGTQLHAPTKAAFSDINYWQVPYPDIDTSDDEAGAAKGGK